MRFATREIQRDRGESIAIVDFGHALETTLSRFTRPAAGDGRVESRGDNQGAKGRSETHGF